MRRRRWGRRAAGWALALLAAGAAGWVGLEHLRPPLLIRVTAQEQREAAMRQGYARLKAQFAAVQAVYPQAELSRALEDPRFLRLVTHGVDAKSAYELTHLRELTAGAMAYGARRAREELTAAMQAGYLRPRESGLTPGAGGAFAESPEHWSRQTREELKTRARRGETIRL